MKRIKLLMFLAVVAIQAHDMVPGTGSDQPQAIVNATICPVSSEPLENGILVFKGEKIVYVGNDAGRIPQDAVRIDAKGAWIYPGLIAADTQVGLSEIDAVRATNDNREIGDFNPEVRADEAYNPDSEIIPTLRSAGILVAQTVPEGSLITGRSAIMAMDGWSLKDCELRASDGIHVNFTISRWGRRAGNEKSTLDDISRRAAEVRSFLKDTQAYADLKKHDPKHLKPDTRLDATLPLFQGKSSLFIHADDEDAIRQALAIAAEFKIRTVIVGASSAAALLPEIKQSGVALVLQSPLSLPAHNDDDYDKAYRLPLLVKDAGISFCVAQSGTWGVRSLAAAAAAPVAFGMDEADAVKSITLNAAQILGVDDRLGSLNAGKDATFIFCEGNILDISQSTVTRAYILGKEVDLNDRNKQLYQKYSRKYKK